MQLKANEVRIGNYATIGDGPFKISISDIKRMSESDHHIYKPIPLTEGWLINFGFIKDDNIGYDDYMYCNGIFTLFQCKYSDTNDFTYPLLMRYGNPNEYKSGLGVKYVHQLQNLYFATNYEELKETDEYGI